ncbi:unnamed protein product [Adineta steineri]|uniref:G domain-containing protein n=1 Tax=Adineta steineri TaxID=433720 RepID=A0A818R6L8_9BILA|nr:unnamed protein product [Adineta steineri]CAF3652577.1 unnamed protein product [Adineta steineri]
MANNEFKQELLRPISVTTDVVLGVAAENLQNCIHGCEQDNPQFVADHAKSKLQEFTFVVCGAPKTGKSTLINAIINKDVAPTKSGTSAVTLETKCYSLEGNCPNKTDEQTGDIVQEGGIFRINIWDTKGITTWDSSIIDIIEEKHPMCMIICASPGSFAKDDILHSLIDRCVNLNIFVALVCTNQYIDSDEKRIKIMQEFDDLLKVYNTERHEENGIIYYGKIGLIAMVNSIPYSNTRTGIYKAKCGVNSMIHGIMKSLNEEQLLGWCYTLMDNEGFWSEMNTQIRDFFAQKFTYGKSILWSMSKVRTWLKT